MAMGPMTAYRAHDSLDFAATIYPGSDGIS